MGAEVSIPVIVSPTGVRAVHPEGEVAVARAAAHTVGLSSFASKPLRDVVAANPATFFQVYWMGGRDRIAAILEHARTAKAKGIILTLD